MHILCGSGLRDLITNSTPPCVSIYLPTYRAGDPDSEQNRIRLKNALEFAEDRLTTRGMRRPEAIEFLEPASALLNDAAYWRDAREGLAIFCSAKHFAHWKLPCVFEEWVWIGDRPYIKPLLPALKSNQQYYVLAVSENEVKLLRGTPFDLAEVEVEEMPKNLKEALHFHPPEGLYQVRTGQPAYHSKEGLVFHGQGAGEAEHAKEELEEYFREIDRVVSRYLKSRHADVPLVFCGVEYLFPIYRRVNSYPHLHPLPIGGNSALIERDDLVRQANERLRRTWEQPQYDDRRRIESSLHSERVSASIEEILPAAQEGRAEALFVALDEKLWGTYNANQRITQISETANVGEDLLDRAAAESFLHGARVYAVPAVELPAGLLAVALYRY